MCRKQRSEELACEIIAARDVGKCTAILMRLAQAQDRCDRLDLEKKDAVMKRVTVERELERVKQTLLGSPFEGFIRTSCIPQELHDSLHKFVQSVTPSEFEKSQKDELDEGFDTERWYDFTYTESQVCTHTHT